MADKERALASIDADESDLLHFLPKPVFTSEVAPYSGPKRITSSKNLSCESIVNPETYSYLDLEVLRSMAAETGALDTEEVITYCGGCIAVSSTALTLTVLDVENVPVYDGSLSEWAIDPDLPMETG